MVMGGTLTKNTKTYHSILEVYLRRKRVLPGGERLVTRTAPRSQ